MNLNSGAKELNTRMPAVPAERKWLLGVVEMETPMGMGLGWRAVGSPAQPIWARHSTYANKRKTAVLITLFIVLLLSLVEKNGNILNPVFSKAFQTFLEASLEGFA